MTDTWVKNTLESMDKDKIRMETDNPSLEKWTENDSYIMEDAIREGIEGKQLQAINRCRLYLRAITRSDLSNRGGLEILPEMLKVERGAQSFSSTRYNWPHQERPSMSDRREWMQAMHQLYGVDMRYKMWRQDCGRWTMTVGDSAE